MPGSFPHGRVSYSQSRRPVKFANHVPGHPRVSEETSTIHLRRKCERLFDWLCGYHDNGVFGIAFESPPRGRATEWRRQFFSSTRKMMDGRRARHRHSSYFDSTSIQVWCPVPSRLVGLVSPSTTLTLMPLVANFGDTK